jgi:hypothetical protein
MQQGGNMLGACVCGERERDVACGETAATLVMSARSEVLVLKVKMVIVYTRRRILVWSLYVRFVRFVLTNS